MHSRLATQRDHAIFCIDLVWIALVERWNSNAILTSAVMEASSIFHHCSVCHFRGRRHCHLILYVFDPFDILGAFSRQVLLCLAGCIALQCHGSAFGVNLSHGAHVPMKQKHGFHFRSEPRIGHLGAAFTFDFQPVVHACSPGRPATASFANNLWDSSETVPVKVTTPSLD